MPQIRLKFSFIVNNKEQIIKGNRLFWIVKI